MTSLVEQAAKLTPRWRAMLMHPERRRLLTSRARHRVVAAGRRSGKTEDAKRIILAGDDGDHPCCLMPPPVPNPRFGIFAPTREQVKRNWWDDIKAMCPRWAVRKIMEDELSIQFVTGAKLYLIGLDKPARAEGDPFDGVVVDESAEVKEKAWSSSLRPTLSNRGRPPGWSLRIGRPKGRTHFYDWWIEAKTKDDHASFHWKSEVVLPEAEITAARDELDELSFRQEYEADWVNFEGLAYYQWDPNVHLRALTYDANLPLVFCFDFNVDPGVAVVLQDQALPQDGKLLPKARRCESCRHEFTGDGLATGEPCGKCRLKVPTLNVTCVIGEVHIPRNSNTPAVCNTLAQRWAHHKGPVHYYGDATGGARKTSQTEGTDWDLVRAYLRPHFHDLRDRVERANPYERDRVNAVNTRLRNAAGVVRLLVDPNKAPNVVRDFEGVTLLAGGSGEIDKKADEKLSHLSDAIGYFVFHRHPIAQQVVRVA